MCTIRLPNKLGLWNRNPNFRPRHRLQHPKLLGLRSHSPSLEYPNSSLFCPSGAMVLYETHITLLVAHREFVTIKTVAISHKCN